MRYEKLKNSQLDLMMSHAEALKFVRENGYDAFLKWVNEKFQYKLSSASMSWEENKKYICKMRGMKGDVIIGWFEHQGKR